MSSSTLPLEIAETGLTHCYYLSLHCRNCGDFRIGTDQNPFRDRHVGRGRTAPTASVLGSDGGQRRLGAYREMLARVLRARGKGRLGASRNTIPSCSRVELPRR